MDVSVEGVLETEEGLQEGESKRGKESVGPGLRVCKAGYETNSCGDLRVRWRGPYALKGGAGHGRVKAVAASKTFEHRFALLRSHSFKVTITSVK